MPSDIWKNRYLAVHTHVEAPASDTAEAGQGKHAGWPSLWLYDPEGHRWQELFVPCRDCELNVPVGHGSSTELPAGQ
jgi:hypothetical protein